MSTVRGSIYTSGGSSEYLAAVGVLQPWLYATSAGQLMIAPAGVHRPVVPHLCKARMAPLHAVRCRNATSIAAAALVVLLLPQCGYIHPHIWTATADALAADGRRCGKGLGCVYVAPI